MGKLNYIKGDLFNTHREIICHGVNCRGKFGSGVAGQIAKLYPKVKDEYLKWHNSIGWQLGDTQFVHISPDEVSGLDERYIVNMATQYYYGRRGFYVNYDAVRSTLDHVIRFAQETGFGVAMPKVGCGLAGGEWSIVQDILLGCLAGRTVEVDVHHL